LRIYLIGAGVIARTHAKAAAKLPETVQLRVADPNPIALHEFISKFPEAVAFPDAKKMLNSEPSLEDDIVVVCTPPFAHYDPTKLAFESGRHVLCEKPLVMNLNEAKDMLRFAEQHGKLLGCCSVRYKGMHHMEAVKKVIRSGQLGDIYHVTFINKSERSRPGIEYQPSSQWFLDSARSGGGILMDWGPYDFTTLNDILAPSMIDFSAAWKAQPKTEIDPIDIPFDVETHVGAYMTFHCDGQPIAVHYERSSCAHGEGYVRAEIEGTLGAVRWTPFDSRQPVFFRKDEKGQSVEEEVKTEPRKDFTIFDNPLIHLYDKVKNMQSYAHSNQRVVDHFHCLSALYACAETGNKQIVNMTNTEEL
jgi:predicted dehydrogenase